MQGELLKGKSSTAEEGAGAASFSWLLTKIYLARKDYRKKEKSDDENIKEREYSFTINAKQEDDQVS